MFKELKKRSTIKCNDYEYPFVHVSSHLSLTPSEMLRAANEGVPIASQVNDNNFYDGDASPEVALLPEHVRGIDMNDMWNAEQNAKKKLSKLRKYSTPVTNGQSTE